MIPSSFAFVVVVATALVLPACAGSSLDVGNTKSDPINSENGSDGDAATKAKAACASAEHGPVAPYTSPAEIATLLTASWYSCDSPTPSAMRSSPGIEFSADGRWTRLVDDGQGGLARATGIDNQGTWKVFGKDGTFHDPTDTTLGEYPYVYLYNSAGGESATEMVFESGPRRLRSRESTSGLLTWFVPIDMK